MRDLEKREIVNDAARAMGRMRREIERLRVIESLATAAIQRHDETGQVPLSLIERLRDAIDGRGRHEP